MKRKIYNELIEWKNNKIRKPLMLLGVRQCGKTYIIKKFCEENYSNYKKLDLLVNSEIIDLYKQNINSEEKYIKLKTLIDFDIEDENNILFIDEIQECEELISDLKYICEEHNNVNIICAGSLLGVKLKRFSKSFPVGKVWIKNMYPMSFDEFLVAFGEDKYIDEIRNCYEKNKSMIEPFHHILTEYYKLFLITGGMPESVQNLVDMKKDISNYDDDILSSIIESYFADMKKHVKNETETIRIRKIYDSLSIQLGNNSHKFQYSKIEDNSKAREYDNPLEWLINSFMINISYAISKPSIPLEGYKHDDTYKIYFSDVGILINKLKIKKSDIIMDNLEEYKGIISENYVANELIKNNISLYYWLSNATAEVDFVVNLDDGIIPIEVKASDNTQSKSLKTYIEKYNPKYSIRISTKNFGYNDETKIKSVPLYATFIIK